MAKRISRKSRENTPVEGTRTDHVAANAADGTNGSGASLDYEEVARTAYSYWENRGYQGGSPEEDWFRAEQELRSKLQREDRREA